jgi:hypothetical protein
MAIQPAVTPATPLGALPRPCKSPPMTPRALHTSPCPSPLLSHARNPPRRVFHDLVMPPPLLGRYSAPLSLLRPVLLSPFCAPASELWRTGVAGGQAPVSAPSCPGSPLSVPPLVHGGPSTPGRSTKTWTRSTNLSIEK